MKKMADRLKQEEQLAKQMKQDVHRIKGIVKNIVKEQKKSVKVREARQAQKAEDKKDPLKCKLGKAAFEPMFPEVLLSDEVTGHIRDTVMSDNAVMHQFKRLQERKLIEPRKKRKLKKRKLKRKDIKLHKYDAELGI